MSVTSTRSAAARARPNSAANSRVREYRWGWNTATSRFHPPRRGAGAAAPRLRGERGRQAHDPPPPPPAEAGGGQAGRALGRVVGVVVDPRDPTGLGPQVEAP